MPQYCRDRRGNLPVVLFQVFTCSMCYNFLFHTDRQMTPSLTQPWILVPSKHGLQHFDANFSVVPNVTNSTVRNIVCDTLSSEDCRRWTSCCYSAISCCERQLSIPERNTSQSSFCPRTWDGYSCIGDTKPSTRVHLQCPDYVEHASTSATAYKDCDENGTWWRNPKTGEEWTNYTTCIHKQDFHTVVYVALACNVVSLLVLVAACFIFLGIRQLRSQNRIKLHVCLFASFTLECIVTIAWDAAVYLDRLENEQQDSVMYRNSGWCKFLYILTRYVSTANFFWMFCEGFYLHRLIVHAFSAPKTLIPYYIFGWLVSWVPSITYSIIRATNTDYNQSCWVHNIGAIEWLMYTPNILTLVINVVFLGNILRILCGKLQAHPNEPNNYRKALKATFVLVPLFGLQQFLVIYRIPPGTTFAFVYDIIQTVIKTTKGAIVALIFCFFNGEVHSHLRNIIGRHVKMGSSKSYARRNSSTSNTQFTSFSSIRRGTKTYENSDRGYIPLSPSGNPSEATCSATNDSHSKDKNGHVTFAA